MRPWFAVAVLLIAAVVVLSWILYRTVRKNCPYLAGRAFMPDALERLAVVRDGTEIDIVDRDLRPLAGALWESLLESWLNRGARIRYLVHALDRKRELLLRRLAAKKRRGTVKLFVIREEEHKADIVCDTADCHFVVFRGPEQLWIEGSHPAGEERARDCEYVPRASRDERWGPRQEDFAALVSRSYDACVEVELDRAEGKS